MLTRPDPITYLHHAANASRAYKQRLLDADLAMVEEAKRRTTHLPVDVRLGDVHALPLEDRGVDRTRIDPVLRLVADPTTALAELRRVLRPAGRAAPAQPDWETLAVDPGPVATDLAFNRFGCDRVVPNPVVGRQLARLAREVSLTVTSIEADAQLLHDFTTADGILGLTRNAHRAVRAGRITRPAAEAWPGGPHRRSVPGRVHALPGDGQRGVSGVRPLRTHFSTAPHSP